jgi:hypothetical protein
MGCDLTEQQQIYDPRLHALVESAIERTLAQLRKRMPRSADRLAAWLSSLSGGRPLAAYFTHVDAFPTLLFPWWLDTALGGGEPDLALQSELVLSYVSGYYAVRLIDDLMDGAAPETVGLLPVLAHLHVEFEAPYQRLFPPSSGFWSAFHQQLSATADATIADASLRDIDAVQFRTVSASKVSAARIPLLAVALQHELETIPPRWEELFGCMSAWHQLHNDFIDWQRDLAAHVETWFLSEGRRRAAVGESIEMWVVREGFEWGVRTLDGWMRDMRLLARELSPGAVAYLDARAARFESRTREAHAGIAALQRLGAAAGC